MLYEVITGRLAHVAVGHAQRRLDVGVLPAPQHCVEIESARELEVPEDILDRVARITSYNVCYTKLLREQLELRCLEPELFQGDDAPLPVEHPQDDVLPMRPLVLLLALCAPVPALPACQSESGLSSALDFRPAVGAGARMSAGPQDGVGCAAQVSLV